MPYCSVIYLTDGDLGLRHNTMHLVRFLTDFRQQRFDGAFDDLHLFLRRLI